MREKGFATVFGLCLILIIALVVKGLQEAEANHAREVLNFETEQALQSAAESAIVEAAELVRSAPGLLPKSDGYPESKKNILHTTKTFKQGGRTLKVTIEVWGERGLIYFYDRQKKKLAPKNGSDGVYFMSRAATQIDFWSNNVYRRAYAYVLDNDAKIRFMELPTQGGNVITK